MATNTTTHEVPEWEGRTTTGTKKSLFSKLEDFPASEEPSKQESIEAGSCNRTSTRRYLPLSITNFFYHSRKRAYIICGIGAVLLLALILGLGLGLGLSHKSSKQSAKNLPLPTNAATFTGDLTYYSPGPGYGACGYENTETEAICAVSHLVWDAVSTSTNPNLNPLCGKKIRITRYFPEVGGNRSVDVQVVDRCVGCLDTDLDLSIAMFTTLAEEGQGRVVGSWAWLDGA
ncbi:uncharacterized protein BP5553_00785 [Venustampulla echinocandica]|uniref:Barwin domain-containing protein n=1 Tax=Venustampulla echinocandica TaxID=2656787 RepID=A0A370TZ54_9HELO|nr:uncharacterized protein BP5553_00785 [Venustampulla echinocandica]RDL40806.1 hypothetical protein BP5553_00785 [Venustampulla echinocandica]